MKRMTKKCIIILFIFSIVFAAIGSTSAETIFTDENGFSYTQLDGDFASIRDWSGESDTLSFPLMVNDSYVKEIGAWAFSDRDDFSSVSFYQADYLSVIGTMAFKGSAISGTVNLPAQVKTIGISAFQNCALLKEVYYNTTADIPDQCFYKCSSLERVTIAAGVSKIGSLAFADCESLSYLWIPDTVTEIHETAFSNDAYLVIYCYTDSYAHEFAETNGIDYVLIDAPATVTVLLGDANGDGKVNILDATRIQRLLVLLDVDPDGMMALRGDVNGDGLNILDATKIQRYLASYSVNEPIGTEVTREVPAAAE